MVAETKAQRANREALEKAGGVSKRLPIVWKGTIYVSLAVLTLTKLIYSTGVFGTATVGDCVYRPSVVDVWMADVSTVAAIFLVTSLVMGLHHLENR